MSSYLSNLIFGLLLKLTQSQDLIITGVVDGDLSGGNPKAVEFYALEDIPDLSLYGTEVLANGASSGGSPGYNFPSDSLSKGEFIYATNNPTLFVTWFGMGYTTYQDGGISINGNDVVELYYNNAVIDLYGEPGVDGTGTAWEYKDGWAYRADETGPNPTFTESEWTFANGVLDGSSNNAEAGSNAFPIGTYTGPSSGTIPSVSPSNAPSTTPSISPSTAPSSVPTVTPTAAPIDSIIDPLITSTQSGDDTTDPPSDPTDPPSDTNPPNTVTDLSTTSGDIVMDTTETLNDIATTPLDADKSNRNDVNYFYTSCLFLFTMVFAFSY